jgi:hypothetical protein
MSFTVTNNESNIVEFKSKIFLNDENSKFIKQIFNLEEIFIKILSSMAEKSLFYKTYLEGRSLSFHLKYKIKNSNLLNKYLNKNIYLFNFFSVQDVINMTKNRLKLLTFRYG